MSTLKRRTGLVGAATGVLVVGAGVGLAVERYLVGRRRKPDPDVDVPLGSLRGESHVVTTADGVQLHAEIDHPVLGARTGAGRDAGRDGGRGAGRDGGRGVGRGERSARGSRRAAEPPPLTVVFVHGYSLNLDCWHFQRRVLRGEHRLVFYDQRSHGRSGRSSPDMCNVDQLGDDLAEVIEQLAPEGPLVLVGHSMGGMTVLALAGSHPEIFERVVAVGLLATSAGDMDKVTLGAPGPLGRLVHRFVPGFIAVLSRAPDLVEHGRKAGSDVGYLLTKRYSFASKVPPARAEFLTEMLAATPIEVVADFFPGFADHDAYEALPLIENAETLIMCGHQDIIVPIEHSRELATRLPLADYVDIADCGHMLILEYPDLVNEHLLGLVERGSSAATWEASG